MKKIVTCIFIIILFVLLLQNSSFAAETTYLGMNEKEWNTYFLDIFKKINDAEEGKKTITYDEYYIMQRAKYDFDKKCYYTGKELKESKLSKMDTGELRMNFDNAMTEVDVLGGHSTEVKLNPPNYSLSTHVQIFKSTDKRYWARQLIVAYEKQLAGQPYDSTLKKDLDILYRCKKMDEAGSDVFPTITKEEAFIYTQYWTGDAYGEGKFAVGTTTLFKSFESYINIIQYIKDKENEESPGNGSTNPGDGSTNPGGGSANPGGGGITENPVNEFTLGDIVSGADGFLNSANHDPIKVGNLQKMSDNIYNILFFVGIFAAVIVGGILGIKFLIEGAEGKAEVKTMLVPYVIGCVVLFGAFAIWKIVLTILQA